MEDLEVRPAPNPITTERTVVRIGTQAGMIRTTVQVRPQARPSGHQSSLVHKCF